MKAIILLFHSYTVKVRSQYPLVPNRLSLKLSSGFDSEPHIVLHPGTNETLVS
jgi:hypothetical protein